MNMGCIGTRRSSLFALFARKVPQTVHNPRDTNGAPGGAIGGADRAADLGSALRSRRRVPAPAMRVHV
jgi:hypothetical protein